MHVHANDPIDGPFRMAILGIQRMLEAGELPAECPGCGATCRSVRRVRIADDEFSAVLPLRVCWRCWTLVAWRFVKDFFLPGARAVAIALVPFALVIAPQASWPWTMLGPCGCVLCVMVFALSLRRQIIFASWPELAMLVTSVPAYRGLIEAAPEAALTCLSPRSWRTSAATSQAEAERFAASVRFHHACRYLTGVEAFQRSGLPHAALFALAEIVDAEICAVASQLLATSVAQRRTAVAIDVGAVLLPGRRWEFDVQAVPASAGSCDELIDQLTATVSTIPVWSVGYPVVFSVRRLFESVSDAPWPSLQSPFIGWAAMADLGDDISYAEAALKVYDIPLPVDPPDASVCLADCERLLQRMPENSALRVLHAGLLESTGRYAEAVEVFDGLVDEHPDRDDFVHQRITCLGRGGWVERAAAECQRRVALRPDDAIARAMLADLQLHLGQCAEALQTIDGALALDEQAQFFRQRGTILAVMGRLREAESAANVAIFQDRDCDEAWLLRAKLRFDLGRRHESLADVIEFHRCGGKTLESLQLQARALVLVGQAAAAEAVYRETLEQVPSNVDAKLQYAEFLADNGKLEMAREECDQLILKADRPGPALATRAAVSLELGNFAEALRDTERALELGHEDPRLLVVRGIARASLGDVSAGIQEIERCLDRWPDHAAALFHRGRMRLALHHHESAINDFSAALASDPNLIDALQERGCARLGLEEHSQAEADFDQVILRAPTRAEAYTGRATARAAAGRRTAAAEDVSKALEIDPDDVRARLLRARLLQEEAEPELAKEDLNAILLVQPDNGAALWQRAHLSLRLGNFSEARDDFDRLVAIDSEHPQSLIGRSVAFEMIGDLEKAEADREAACRLGAASEDDLHVEGVLLTASVANSNEQYAKAVELTSRLILEHPDPPLASYRIRGHSRWYSDEFVEALEDYEVLTRSEAATRHDFSAYGQLLCELGEYERGLESLDRSVEIARERDDRVGLAYSLSGRGRALSGLGRFQEAEEAFAESLRLKPGNAWLHFHLGLMHMDRNEPSAALECLERALSLGKPKLSPPKRRRAAGLVRRIRDMKPERE